MPWNEADTIEHCADALLKLPTEIHLGPEHIMDRFEQMQLLKIGPIASLQLPAHAVVGARARREAGVRSRVRIRGAAVADPAPDHGGARHQARQPGTGVLPAAPLRLQPEPVSDHQIPLDEHLR
jgi:hypothetical protein